MSILQFVAEWALRSSILIVSGALLLWATRVRYPSIRLAAWTAILFGSLAMPLFTAVAPRMWVPVMHTAPRAVEVPVANYSTTSGPPGGIRPHETHVPQSFDWVRAGATIYVLVAGALLLRLCVGLALSLRLLRGSRATGKATGATEIRESDRVVSPVALGIVRPAIVLPGDWRQWDEIKLDAVLAHEGSHISRRDPAVQLLSAIHRALLWHSPMSWLLHRRIVRVAEEASDDAAIAATRDRASYAEMLLQFMQRGAGAENWPGVPMARYGRPDGRIHRILDGTTLPRKVTRWTVAAILVIGSPLAYVAAAAHPRSATQTPVVSATAMPAQTALEMSPPQPIAIQSMAPATPQPAPVYITALGSAAANTVTVRPRIDGQLMSVNFKEGERVQAGQVLANIDPRPFQVQLAEAEGQLARDQAQLAAIMLNRNTTPKDQFDPQVTALQGSITTDQAKLDNAKLQLNYTQIVSPIAGVAGLRLVDPGNIVHGADTTGIVIVNQLQPIAVVFSIPEDRLPQVRARLQGSSPVVEAWNRDNSAKLAIGHLIAIDNQIDQDTGTVRLKAIFDNKDGALFPNQFVNVRLFLRAR